MNIGELSKCTGLSTLRIRFYEQSGLLPAAQRGLNGYRSYPPEMVQMLEWVVMAQKVGFSLEDIRALLPRGLQGWDHDGVVATLRQKLADIKAMEKQLQASKRQVQALLADIEARPDDMDCQDNARRVLTHVLAQQSAFLPSETAAEEKMGQLMRAARKQRANGAGT